MDVKIEFMLDSNPLLKRYLREHSNYYKNIVRDSNYIYEVIELMKREYHLTLPDKLNKIKDNISLVNTFMDVLK